MSQIWVRGSHFSEVNGYCWFWWCFNRKVWLVDHIIIVMLIIVSAMGGLPKCAKFGCSGHTFGGCWLLLILVIVSTHCIFAKNAPVFRPYFYKNEPVWRISHTASTYILMLLLALYCTFCAPTPFLYTLHSSHVMLWGLKRAMSGYLVG